MGKLAPSYRSLDFVADQSVLDESHRPMPLGELWQRQPRYMFFVRHFG